MKTAIYIRVSTQDQNIDLQMDGLLQYAERAGMEITHQYIEQGVSGKQEKRPQLNQLMKDARNYAFENVLVWKFDRFARSVSHLLKALEEFNHLQIRFISVKDQIDTSSPIGKAMFVLIGAISELESDLISERVKAGMKAAKARGKVIGRPKTSNHIIRKVQKMAVETDLSISQIKNSIAQNVSRAVVGRIVKNARNQT